MKPDNFSPSIPNKKNAEMLQDTKLADQPSTMVRVLPGNTVSVHYTRRLEDGTVFFSTENKEPFIFTQGQRAVVPRVEQAVLGMAPGESKRVHIPEEEAYGAYNPELAVKIDRSEFDKRGIKAEIGHEFGVRQTDWRSLPVRVTDMDDATVTIDANHPLAGHSIIYDLLLRDILPGSAPQEDRAWKNPGTYLPYDE